MTMSERKGIIKLEREIVNWNIHKTEVHVANSNL